MADQKSSSALMAPVRGAASALRKVPGAGLVGRAAEGTLDKVGAVSPRGRRMAVYAGAGLLGAAGVVEWPVAVTGAAVAWLTQPRPAHPVQGESTHRPEPAQDIGTAALRSGHAGEGRDTATAGGSGPAHAPAGARSPGRPDAAHAGTPPGTRASEPKPSTGPLGPTARPDRTTI
ncbi:hypothetical protein GCM10010503_19770 [Streptomyces lucensis JCM 4490]|uniref:Uncharacterized protein n=1 Tax=Streptomyces lucensis JCM 4490 TaxID=1306176 RepID=A0A918J3B3_9ACTN|nr:hypothetical protein [Streptomyces lucensis]GGW43231.1 hypothetical protein GCM10010503_19770 [Streptomyces lucensis JCM 4490]